MKYDIWKEGFSATCEGSPATWLVKNIEANSFKEACIKHCKGDENFDEEELSLCGCRLFETEKEARKLFG